MKLIHPLRITLKGGMNNLTLNSGAQPDISGARTDTALKEIFLKTIHNKGTQRLYRRAIERLLEFLPVKDDRPDHKLSGALLSDWVAFSDDLLGDMRPNTAATVLAAARAFFTFAHNSGYVLRSPAHILKIRRPPQQKSSKELTDEEVLQLIQAAATKRDRVLLEVLYVTGIRAHELTGLVWRDVRQVNQDVLIQVLGKGGKVRTIMLPPKAGQRLLRLKTLDNEPDDGVFTTMGPGDDHPWKSLSRFSVINVVQRALSRTAITKPVTPHWFRHAYAQHARKHGIEKGLIQEALGHDSMRTTEGYLAAQHGLMLAGDFITERE